MSDLLYMPSDEAAVGILSAGRRTAASNILQQTDLALRSRLPEVAQVYLARGGRGGNRHRTGSPLSYARDTIIRLIIRRA